MDTPEHQVAADPEIVIPCPECSAPVGDTCRGFDYCEARSDAVRVACTRCKSPGHPTWACPHQFTDRAVMGDSDIQPDPCTLSLVIDAFSDRARHALLAYLAARQPHLIDEAIRCIDLTR